MVIEICDCINCNNKATHTLTLPRSCYAIARNKKGDILSRFYQGVLTRDTNICDEHFLLLAKLFNSAEI